ncbi:mitochondrial fission ELM1 family protein [Parahaliea mediterranea]|uniref:Mitochondrial fission ELM1 family protein n=1 Tax=Parahaliea mediterranea TaxID=651086 RepID=A0A939IMG6_9GAMM|nr:ELM1/GtrOC1 family putative glycosyltransferase [Parahaliea mediterranea]MBN7797013.1 mitochondrial fission ELM1 family protein [Parahaliea mediterranea]
MQTPLTIWCVTDGKPGHRSQMLGLVEAMAERAECQVGWLTAGRDTLAEAAALKQRPALILCTGHRTHWPAIRLKWRFGGMLVALLKPSLPLRLFDLCVVPEHDGARVHRRILRTCGTLNDIRPAEESADPGRGLILIGGPSKHHGWDDRQMLDQIARLRDALPALRWTLTTSRRTPASFVDVARQLADERLRLVPVEDTDREWLRDHYAGCGVIWVSEDSASMVYEALTSGARVGILPVPRQRESRVSRGLDALLRDGWVTGLADLCRTGHMGRQRRGLREADRVADYLYYCIRRQDSTVSHESPPGVALPK